MKIANIKYADVSDAILNKVVVDLSQAFPVRYIICWGITTDHQERITCFDNGLKQIQKHFFLLVITDANTPLEQDIQDYIESKYENGEIVITAISCGFANVNEGIMEGNRFFITVCSKGYLMYSSDGLLIQLDYPVLDHDITLTKAEQHFHHRYHMAEGFLLAAEQSLDGGYYNHAVFLLHQTTEQACIAITKVFLGYRPDTHNIKQLIDLCCSNSKKLKTIFTYNQVTEQLFDLMRKSDVDARYQNAYVVQSTEAESLYQLVHEFVELTQVLCKEKIGDYQILGASGDHL
ncbi:HEPN domain-containing protein [Mucilaginibacter sp. UYP25]|uniref:HEPN domain-containing protein n=1 Tax=unclassified Mucilaginibacter TaxID=2617802 RepID=UPI003394BA94